VGIAAALLLSLLIGLSLGTLGSGGSIITMPVLVYVAGVPAQPAVAMSLVVVGATAAIGSLVQGRRSGIDLRAGAIFAATGLAGAFAGAKLTHLVPAAVLMTVFAALMIGAGVRMLTPRPIPGAARSCRAGRCAAVGVVLGLLTGFLGVGGGFLIMPALVLLAGIDLRRAVPTSLAIIAVNAAGGLAGQVRHIDLDWPLTLAVLASALTGMLAGTAVTARVSADRLGKAFAWIILSVGSAVLAREALRAAGLV
jgi:uncharacterized membrane protein YfcA